MSRQTKALAAVVSVILIYFLANLVLMVTGLQGWTTRPPQWDPASHALDGIHFAQSFQNFSPSQFLVQLHNSAMWPPVIPLIQAPFQILFGDSFVVSRSWTAWMSLPAVLIVFLTGLVSHRRFGLLVGTIAASLLAVSPLFQDYTLQEMLEIPGVFFCTLTLFFYIRFITAQKEADWKRTCLSGIVLFFCKFNYAVIMMLPIVISEFANRPDFRRLVFSAIVRFVKDVRWRSGFTRFVLFYTGFLIYVQKVGVHFEIAGHPVYIERALGNPTYFLFGILLIRNLIFNRQLLLGYIRNIWNAPQPVRSLLRFDILPAMVWMSYPVFFTTFFIFMFSEKTRKNSFWSLETLTFYPGALLKEYSPHPVLGALSLVALIGMLYFWKRLPRISRFLVGLTTFNLALTILHPNYQIRYLMTSVPFLYLVTGLGIAHVWEALTAKRGSTLDPWVQWIAPPLAAALVFCNMPSRERLQKAFEFYSLPESVSQVYAAICDESVATEKNTVVGFSNFTSPASIALECYKKYPAMRREQMPTTVGRHGFQNEKSGVIIVGKHVIDRFFVIDYSQLGQDVGRLQEPFLLDAMKSSLTIDPAYESAEIINQGPGGYRVTVYRKKIATPAPAAS